MHLEKWPLYFVDMLKVGNPESNAAVCTLWTEKERIAAGLIEGSYACIGHLFYSQGINYLARNLLANPNIRYLILCGSDLSKSGEALVNFMSGSSSMTIGLPDNALKLLRDNVRVIDMRGTIEPEHVAERIASLPKKEPYTEPMVFTMPEPEAAEAFPTAASGFVCRAGTVAEAWLKILHNIMKFGYMKKSQYSSDQKELMNLTAVIENEDPDNIFFAPYFQFTLHDLNRYYPQVMTKSSIQGVSYTYGQRFRDYDGIDQIKYIIDELRDAGHSRRAVAVSWQAEKDTKAEHSPCWVLLQALVQHEKLFLTCFIRSNDMFDAWPMNAFALRKVQQEIALALELELGSLTTISGSAHLYEPRWEKSREIVKQYYEGRDRLAYDQRGNFVIHNEGGEIIATHTSHEGKVLRVYKGASAEKLYTQITRDEAASEPQHLAYIGYELAKAETALRMGIAYVQDKPLDFGAAKKE